MHSDYYNTSKLALPGCWYAIPGYAGYFASFDGTVISTRKRKPHLLKPWRTADGYLQVSLAGRKRYVHRLVALTFHGEPPPGDIVVHHADHARDRNIAANLEYLSRAENSRRRLPSSLH